MRRPFLLTGLSLLLIFATPPPHLCADDKEAAIAERDKWWSEAIQHANAHEFAEAIAAGEKALAIDRDSIQNEDFIAFYLRWLGTWYVEVRNFPAAQKARKEQLALQIKLKGKGHWSVADVEWALRDIDRLSKFTDEERRETARLDGMYAAINKAARQGDFKTATKVVLEQLAGWRKLLPAPHPDLALVTNNAGYFANESGDPVAARPYYEQALDMRERAYPTTDYPAGHPDIASSLSNLGFLLSELGELAAAQSSLEKALAMRERLYPEADFPEGADEIGVALNNLASVLEERGDLAAAEQLYTRRLAMSEKLYPTADYPNGHEDLAHSLNAMGHVLNAQGKLTAARQFYARALAMRKLLFPQGEYPRGNLDLAVSLSNLANVLQDQGQLSEARRHYEQALEMQNLLYPKEEYPQGHPQLASAYINLAELLIAQGELSEARSYYQDALAINQRLYSVDRFPQGHPVLATTYSNVGSLLESLNELREARRYFEQALAMRQQLYPASDYPQGHPDIALSLSNLGSLIRVQGDVVAARPYYEQALAMRERLFSATSYPEGHPDLATSINNLGYLLQSLGDFADAQRYFQQSLAMNERLYPSDEFPKGHPDLATSLTNLAHSIAAQGNRARALDLYLAADEMTWNGLESLFLASSEQTMHAYLGQLDSNDFAILSLLNSDPTLVAKHPDSTLKVLRRRTAIFDALLRLRRSTALASTNKSYRDDAERLHVLRQSIADEAVRPAGTDTADDRTRRRQGQLAELNRLESSLKVRLAEPGGVQDDTAVQVDTLIERIPADAALVQLLEFQPANFAAKLNESGWQPVRYAAIVFTRASKTPTIVDLGLADPIEKQASAIRQHVAGAARELALSDEGEVEAQYRELATPLSRLVVDPILAAIGDARTIYLIPDGELTRIGWEALVTKDEKYLIDVGYQFAYLSSAADLVRPRADAARYGTVVFADPDFNLEGRTDETAATLAKLESTPAEDSLALRGVDAIETRGLSWKRLAATEAEADEIERLLSASKNFAPVTLYRGSEAVESILARIEAPRVLHLATHGFYLPDEKRTQGQGEDTASGGAPLDRGGTLSSTAVMGGLKAVENPLLRSGIVLAGANRVSARDEAAATSDSASQAKPSDDGWVTAEEVGLLDLSGTDLVVLSACETGLGDLRIGEGVAGLRRAFLYAGAETIITSLYKVPDTDTQKLMQQFYTRLAEGATKLDSLHDAQQAIIRARREENDAAHPFFWASFILVGDPG